MLLNQANSVLTQQYKNIHHIIHFKQHHLQLQQHVTQHIKTGAQADDLVCFTYNNNIPHHTTRDQQQTTTTTG